ncbi:MAG TPA: hypothetical protein VJ438_06480 [Candidatus Nanoarchaeia archaeon]|nr:hypothetical protein [Candidatus Nanoarchaeia archaeon]
MATIRIDEKLKELIEKTIKKDKFRWKYQNSKGFVDNAVSKLLKEEGVIKNG